VPSGGNVEPGLDPGRARTRRNQMGAGPSPGREGHTDREHRLACPGLTREYGEPGRQLEIEIRDDAEAADVQLAEHARILAAGADITARRCPALWPPDPRRALRGDRTCPGRDSGSPRRHPGARGAPDGSTNGSGPPSPPRPLASRVRRPTRDPVRRPPP